MRHRGWGVLRGEHVAVVPQKVQGLNSSPPAKAQRSADSMAAQRSK